MTEIKTIPAFIYPLWIKLFACGVVAILFYSTLLLPKYLTAAKVLHDANLAYKKQNYLLAIDLYTKVLEDVPEAREAFIGKIKSLFSTGDLNNNDTLALQLLQGVEFDDKEVEQIKSVMPVKYQELFIKKVEK